MRISLRRPVYFFLLVWGVSSGVMAADHPVPVSDTASASSSETPEFLKPEQAPSFPVVRVILTLVLLVGALSFAGPLLKKTKWGGAPVGGAGLDVIGRVYLGPKAGVCLVRAEGRKFLVGVGADGVRLLADLGPPSHEASPHV